jgi:ferredoxin
MANEYQPRRVRIQMLAARRARILLFIKHTEVAMAKLSITVNKTRCIGSGDCVETAPAVFQLDAEGKSEVIDASGAADSVIVSAARSCPVKAISVVDEAGVQLFPPPKK